MNREVGGVTTWPIVSLSFDIWVCRPFPTDTRRPTVTRSYRAFLPKGLQAEMKTDKDTISRIQMIMWYFINPHRENLFLSATLHGEVRGQAQLRDPPERLPGESVSCSRTHQQGGGLSCFYIRSPCLAVLPRGSLCESVEVVQATCEALILKRWNSFFPDETIPPERSVRGMQTRPLLYKLWSQFAFWIERVECELSSGVSRRGVQHYVVTEHDISLYCTQCKLQIFLLHKKVICVWKRPCSLTSSSYLRMLQNVLEFA